MDIEYVPNRGDIVWIGLDPQRGHEQAGRRPAIVLSPQKYNSKSGLFICCPITSQEKGYPFETNIPSGLPVSGVILSDQVKSLDWRARGVEYTCAVPQVTIEQVVKKISLLILR